MKICITTMTKLAIGLAIRLACVISPCKDLINLNFSLSLFCFGHIEDTTNRNTYYIYIESPNIESRKAYDDKNVCQYCLDSYDNFNV